MFDDFNWEGLNEGLVGSGSTASVGDFDWSGLNEGLVGNGYSDPSSYADWSSDLMSNYGSASPSYTDTYFNAPMYDGGGSNSFNEGSTDAGGAAAGGDQMDWKKKLMQMTSGGGGKSSGGMSDFYKLLSGGSSLYSGVKGMQQAGLMQKQAAAAANRADPWGLSGGRGVADAQLQQLLNDPSGAASSDPAFALRMQGAQRATAQQGQDSGAMAVAGANASSGWYNDRLNQLSGLAGANINPGTAAQLGLQGQTSAADMQSKGLASMGYGLSRLFGGQQQQQMSPQQMMMLFNSNQGSW